MIPRPELISLGDSPRRGAYTRTFRLSGGPEARRLLQRVETRVRFLRDEQVVVRYDGVYWEAFCCESGRTWDDVHDFDLRADGWGVGRLQRLLRRYGLRDPGGEGRLVYEKTFLLVTGEIDDGPDEFGYLDQVAGEASRAQLDLLGEAQVEVGAAPGPVQGQGRLTGELGWSLRERLSFRLATLAGEVDVEPAYQRVEIDAQVFGVSAS